MNELTTEATAVVVGWMHRHAGFPGHRLPAKAEAMLCVAALAAVEESAEQQQRFGLQRRDPAVTSALRSHVLRRTQVHYKCDNSAKV